MEGDVAFLLLAVGALCLYVEFNHPGAVIPGTVGVVFILLAAFALNILPTRFAALGLILGAFALFAAEAKFATHGILTDWRNRAAHAGRPAAGRFANSRNAGSPANRARRQHSAWPDNCLPDDDRSESPSQ